MRQGPRIYNLFPLLAGPLPAWRAHMERAAAMGFTWIFVNPFHLAGFSGSLYSVKDYYAIDPRLDGGSGRPPEPQLRDVLRAASELGLAVMMDLVVNHTAFDAPLVSDHPDWFRRDAHGRIVHPGAMDGQRRVIWEDLAEVDNENSPGREALWAYWRSLALHYAALGFRGFRCDAAYQVPAALWRDLIGAVKARHSEILFFAETLGCTPDQTLATASAGFDFIFNSSKWWDFQAPWCLEQYAATAPVVPSVSFPESHDTPRLAAELNGDREAVLQRYAFAALFSTGVMMPMGFEYGFRKPLHVVKTTPQDWEAPLWDLTGAIAAVNRTKGALRPLNEEGPIQLVEVDPPRVFAFRKRSRDGADEALVALNLDRRAGVTVRVPPAIAGAGRWVWRDPAREPVLPLTAPCVLDLGPSGVLVLHPGAAGRPPTPDLGERGHADTA